MFSRTSINGMGLFEGRPGGNSSPFVAFSRVKPKYKAPEEVALNKYPARYFRPAVMTSEGGAYKQARFKFGKGERPASFTSKDEAFVPVGGRPLPGDYPEDIRPYSGPGWDFVEPYSSAEGLGQNESGFTKFINKVVEFAPKAIEAIKGPRAAPTMPINYMQQQAQPEKSNALTYAIIGGGVLVVGLGAYLLLRR